MGKLRIILRKILSSRITIVCCVLFAVCAHFSIEIHTLVWHLRHGNQVKYNDVTIIIPWDWMLYKKDSNKYAFVHLKSGSVVTLGKIDASKENMAKATKKAERVMFIDGKEAFWERYCEDEPNKIDEYIVIPSQNISIGCGGKIEDIPELRNMLSNIYFSSEQELSSTDNSEVNYYSKVLAKQKEKIQHEILNQGSAVGDKIILANEFLDWLREQKVVDASHIPKIPSSEASSVTIKDAEATFYGVVDGYYPTIGVAYSESGRRVAYCTNIDLLDPKEAWRDTLRFMINEGYSDIFSRVPLAQTRRISDAFFLEEKTRILFGLAHEAITYQSHSLYCIDEPVGMVIPVFLVQKYVQEKSAESGSDLAWAKVEEEITTYLDSYSQTAGDFMSLYTRLNKNDGDRTIISKYLRDKYLDVYGDIETGDYHFSFKLFMISIEPARDDKLGWSYIISEYPYLANYKSVRKIVEDALAFHGGDIMKVCKNFTTMSTPKDQAYKSTKADELAALEKLREALFK